MKNILIMKPFNHMFFIGLLFTAVFTVFLIRKYRDRDIADRRKLIVILYTFVFILFMLYKFMLSMDAEYSALRTSVGADGFNWFGELPLNLCNVNIVLMVIGILLDSRAIMGVCFFAGSLGALLPLMMPLAEFTGYSILLPRMWGYYLTHYFVLMETPLLAGLGIYKPKFSDVFPVTISLMIMTFIATLINLLFRQTGLAPNANYFYSIDPEGNVVLEALRNLIPIPGVYLLPGLLVFIPYILIITWCFNRKDKKAVK